MPPNNPAPNQSPAQPNAIGSGQAPQNPNSTTQTQKAKNPNSSQNTLLFSEIRDNMVVMSDGSFRAVVACKSINFDLMSSREREGVEYSYQNFLNALNHPIQILVRSQRIDIAPYIDKLVETRNNQDNMLLGVLMDDYINYIDILSQEANIMDKSFFIAIPYYAQEASGNLVEQSKGFFGKLFTKPGNVITKIDNQTYERAKTEIKNRVDGVMAGLFQIGVQSVQLNTRQLGELYYNFYNPDIAVRQPLGDFSNLTSSFVRKGGETETANTNGVQTQ